jgi:pyruvate formate lyase activating enzyme
MCLECVDVCPAAALVNFGESYSVGEILTQLRPEYDLYRRSGGGVTLSGGEATLFASYAGRLAEALRDDGIHVALETCGLFQGDTLRGLFDSLDLVLFDLKLFSDALHRHYCGAGNAPIKANFERLAARSARGEGPELWPRMPVIPGVTNTEENLQGWAGFLLGFGLDRLTLVPYHEFGAGKRDWLPGAPPQPAIGSLGDEELHSCREFLADLGIRTFAPGEETLASPVS